MACRDGTGIQSIHQQSWDDITVTPIYITNLSLHRNKGKLNKNLFRKRQVMSKVIRTMKIPGLNQVKITTFMHSAVVQIDAQ